METTDVFTLIPKPEDWGQACNPAISGFLFFPGTSPGENCRIAGLTPIPLSILMTFVGIGAISLIMLIASLFFFLFELGLKLLRAISWRIEEYNKGAFAALILPLTIALGIAEVYLKSTK